MRVEALIALGLLCAANPAVGAAADLWLVSQGVNGMSVSSDASTLACSQGQCSVWEVTRYAEPRPNGVLSTQDLAYYDCAGLRTRTQLEVQHGVGGVVLGTVKATQETWQAVPTGSVGASSLTFACNFGSASPDSIRAGAFEVGGRRFVRLAQSNLSAGTAAAATSTARPLPHASQFAVQIAARPTEMSAKNAIEVFKAKYRGAIADLQLEIEPATLKGARVFRVLVEGFTAEHDARKFCASLKATGEDCFIWTDADRAASSR